MVKQSISCILLCIFYNLLGAQPQINKVSFSEESISIYKKYEIAIELTANYTNPYDYDQIHVQAHFKKPDGDIDVIDGFFIQEKTISETGILENKGTEVFMVRYTPYLVGEYSFYITVKDISGESQNEENYFTVLESVRNGFVRKNETQYLSFDSGEQYIPIGQNICWQTSNAFLDYTSWVSSLAAAGGNFIRLWHAHWGLGIEWQAGWNGHLGLKKYNQETSAYQDWLYDYCDENDVYVMLAIEHHGKVSTITDPNWDSNPINIANGGPCVNTWDFFILDEAKSLTKNRLRYIIARWGYSSAIMSWELFNEVEWTNNFEQYEQEIIDWHLEMAAFIREIDVYKHLITTSFANDVGGESLWDDELMDITQVHYYGNTTSIQNTLVGASQKMIENYEKPVLVGEFGLGNGNLTKSVDPDGIHFHNSMWATLFGGPLGTGMSWWWDSYIHPNNLYYYYEAISSITQEVPFVLQNLQVTKSTIEGAPTDLSLVPNIGWGQLSDQEISISPGNLSPENPRISTFLFGSEFNTQFRSPPNFTVHYPEDGLFTLRTGAEISVSPRINIIMDGDTLINSIAEINSTYTINVSKGPHTIKVDNNGTDWISVTEYIFSDLGQQGNSFTLISEDKLNGAGYVLNNQYNHVKVNDGSLIESIKEGRLIVEGVETQGQNYLVNWFDPLSGEFISSTIAEGKYERFVAYLPEFSWDLMFTFTPSEMSSTEILQDKIEFTIGPNPIQKGDIMRLEGLEEGIIGYRIYNFEGKLMVEEQYISNQILLDNAYGSGTYWIQVYDEDRVSSKPFIIVE